MRSTYGLEKLERMQPIPLFALSDTLRSVLTIPSVDTLSILQSLVHLTQCERPSGHEGPNGEYHSFSEFLDCTSCLRGVSVGYRARHGIVDR